MSMVSPATVGIQTHHRQRGLGQRFKLYAAGHAKSENARIQGTFQAPTGGSVVINEVLKHQAAVVRGRLVVLVFFTSKVDRVFRAALQGAG